MDVVLEDLLDEEVVEAVVQDESKDIALEVLSHYSDKVRQRDLREVGMQGTRYCQLIADFYLFDLQLTFNLTLDLWIYLSS